MNCQDAEYALALAVGGDLPADSLPELDRHLASCARCRAWRQDLEESQAELKRWAGETLDDDELAALRAAVLERTALAKPALDQPSHFLKASRGTPAITEFTRRRFTPGRLGRFAALLLVGAILLTWLAWQPPSPSNPSDQGVSEEPIQIADRELSAPSPVEDEMRPEAPQPAQPLDRIITTELSPSLPPPSNDPRDAGEPYAKKEPAPTIAAVIAETTDDNDDNSASNIQPAPKTETTLVKLISDDPDILIYWLIETEPTTEET